jgi:hypothetical protein
VLISPCNSTQTLSLALFDAAAAEYVCCSGGGGTMSRRTAKRSDDTQALLKLDKDVEKFDV